MPGGLGDEQRLTQVLLITVGSAIKFTDTREVRVTAKAWVRIPGPLFDKPRNPIGRSPTPVGAGSPDRHHRLVRRLPIKSRFPNGTPLVRRMS